VRRVRSLALWDAGVESPLDGYRADQLMAAAAVRDPECAFLRRWSRPQPALSAGRYHRIADGAHCRMQRRLSGGRVVPIGPGLLGLSLAVGSVDWLAAAAPRLRPEQVLNRALRPMLAVLRSLGVDAFYGGRDLVTCGGRPLLHASFCPFSDGAVLIEQVLAVSTSFAELRCLAGAIDPAGVAGMAPESLASAVALDGLIALPPREQWGERLTAAAARAFGADVHLLGGAPAELERAVPADEQAYLAFAYERREAAPAAATAAAVEMLGVVEACAILEDGRVRDMEICGDVIAPFETLEALGAACEGRRAEASVLRRIVARELAGPSRFILGIRDLEDLVARLVS